MYGNILRKSETACYIKTMKFSLAIVFVILCVEIIFTESENTTWYQEMKKHFHLIELEATVNYSLVKYEGHGDYKFALKIFYNLGLSNIIRVTNPHEIRGRSGTTDFVLVETESNPDVNAIMNVTEQKDGKTRISQFYFKP